MLIDELKSQIYGIFLSPHSRNFWLYLVIYFSLAAWILHRVAIRDDNSTSLVQRLFPAHIYRHASFRMDLKLWAVSLIVTRLGIFGVLAVVVKYLSTLLTTWIAPYFPAQVAAGDPVTLGDRAIFTLCSVVVFDLGYFLAHYLSHKLPVLWAFHQVHHAAERLTPITASRFHPVDHLFTAFVGTLMSTVAVSAFTLYHGTEVETITVLNLSVIYFLFLLLSNFRHSHIWIGYWPWLSRILISPGMHQIHHSTEKRHVDRNFGFIFSVWDALFGSQYVPRKQESFPIGLVNQRLVSEQSFVTHLVVPFVDAATAVSSWFKRKSRSADAPDASSNSEAQAAANAEQPKQPSA